MKKRFQKWLSYWKYAIAVLGLLGGPPAVKLGVNRVVTLKQMVLDYPKAKANIERNRVKDEVIMGILMSLMPDLDSAKYEILRNGKEYVDIRIKVAPSDDWWIFLADTSGGIERTDAFWVNKQKDQNEYVFFGNKNKPERAKEK